MQVIIKRLTDIDFAIESMHITSSKKIREDKLAIWKDLLVSAGGVPHSPLRAVQYRIEVKDIPYWVAMHYRTHHVGVQFYIKSQRGFGRGEKTQDALVDMILDINANALITLGKARTCFKAANETRDVMSGIREVLFSGDEFDQFLAQSICPPCKWYQKCFEPKSCKRYK